MAGKYWGSQSWDFAPTVFPLKKAEKVVTREKCNNLATSMLNLASNFSLDNDIHRSHRMCDTDCYPPLWGQIGQEKNKWADGAANRSVFFRWCPTVHACQAVELLRCKMANGNTGSFVSFPNAVIEGSRFSTDFCAASYLKNHEHDERERCILTHNLPIFGLQLVRARWATNKLAENLFTTTTCLLTSYSNLSLSLSVLTICNLRAFTAFSDARL